MNLQRWVRFILPIAVIIGQPALALAGSVPGGPPTAPGTPSAGTTLTNSTSVTWSWSAATDSDGGAFGFGSQLVGDFTTQSVTDYEICIGVVAGGCDVTNNASTSGSTSYTKTGLSDGTYYAKARAKDNEGNYGSYSSNSAAVTVDATAPTLSGVAATSITTTSAVVGWNTNEASTTQVRYGTSSGSYPTSTTLNSSNVTSHTASLSGLTAGTTYYFQALSQDEAGNLGISSQGTFTTTSSGSTSSPTSTTTSSPTTSSTSTSTSTKSPTSTSSTTPSETPTDGSTPTESATTPSETPTDGSTPTESATTTTGGTTQDDEPQTLIQGVSARAFVPVTVATAGFALVTLVGLFGPTISVVTWLTSLSSIILILLNTLLEWIGLRRRRYPWGVVFDADSGSPVELAIVRLRTVQGKLVETRVTDRSGRFGFLANPGQYVLEVSKAGYTMAFPREITRPPYEPVYDGKALSITDASHAIITNIALRRSGARRGINLGRFVPSFRRVLLALTLALGVVNYLLTPSIFAIGVAAVALLVLVAEWLVSEPRGFGVVRDPRGHHAAGVVLKLSTAEGDKQVALLTTDALGRYGVLVRPGTYRLRFVSGPGLPPEWLAAGKEFKITQQAGGLIAPSFRLKAKGKN